MLSNLLFLIKLIRVLKKYNVLILINKNIRFKFLFIFFTNLISIGVSYDRNHKNKSDGLRIAQALNELGPSFVKLGQLISTRPDIVGNTIAEDLSLLRDNFQEKQLLKLLKMSLEQILIMFFHNLANQLPQLQLLKCILLK